MGNKKPTREEILKGILDKPEGGQMIEVADVRKMSQGNVKAFVDVWLAPGLLAKGFHVLDGKQGLFVSAPRNVAADGRWYDVILFTDDDAKKEVENAVLEAYQKEVING